MNPDTNGLLADILSELRAANKPAALLLSGPEAAAFLGIGFRTFERKVSAGVLPRPVSLDGMAVWRRKDLETAVDRLKPGRRKARAVTTEPVTEG